MYKVLLCASIASYKREKSDREENCSPSISIKPCYRAAHSNCVNKTNKRRPRGVLTQTGPQTFMPKSYKLLWCLNKTHINLSSVIFSVEISHFEVLPFNLHLTFVSCTPRRPILTAEAFRSQKRPTAIDGISAHLSAPSPGYRRKNWLLAVSLQLSQGTQVSEGGGGSYRRSRLNGERSALPAPVENITPNARAGRHSRASGGQGASVTSPPRVYCLGRGPTLFSDLFSFFMDLMRSSALWPPCRPTPTLLG
ncbi:hypothetical protein PAMP_014883 [Pampus punctatissimus]